MSTPVQPRLFSDTTSRGKNDRQQGRVGRRALQRRLMDFEPLESRRLLSGQPPTAVADSYQVAVGTELSVDAPPSFVLGPNQVRWEASAGGNGHVYERIVINGNWFDAARAANQRTLGGTKGHLATITSAAENQFLIARLGRTDEQAWIGGYQDVGAEDYAEFDKGWRWITGEPWEYTAWAPAALGASGETYLQVAGRWGHLWNDMPGYVTEQAYWVEYPLDAPVDYVELVSRGATWRYSDVGANLGTEWRYAGFNDQAWNVGAAELGYGDGDEQTIIGYGTDPSQKHMTSYFRRTFTLDDLQGIARLDLLVKRDDGLAVYLNGSELLRNGLGADPQYRSPATAVADEENEYFLFSVDPQLLVSGVNTLAVEVHQITANSDDVSFDLQLTAQRSLPQTVLANDTDPERNVLTAELVAGPLHGTLSFSNDGAFHYIPALGYIGLDQFSYRAHDGTNYSDTATVALNVVSPNLPPVSRADIYAGVSDESLVIGVAAGVLANDTDANGDALQAKLITPPAHGTLTLQADGSFTYIPNAGFAGNDRFSYYATDGLHRSPTTAVRLSLEQVPNTPVARDDRFTVLEDGTLNVNNAIRQTLLTATVPGGTPRWLAYDAVGDMLYATIPGNNTVVPINPYSGETGTPIVIPGGADEIVATTNGQYLYIASDGAQSVTRVRLDTHTIDRTFPLIHGPVSDLLAIPGSPESFVVSVGLNNATYVYDNGQARPVRAGGTDQVEVSDDGRTLYTFASSISSYGLAQYSIEPDGLHTIADRDNLVSAGGMAYADGLLLFGSGHIVDPVGYRLMGVVSRPSDAGVVPLPGTNRVAYISDAVDTVRIYDITTQQHLGSIQVPGRPIAGRGIPVGLGAIAFVEHATSKVYVSRSDRLSGVSRYDLLANDSDPEQDALTAILVTGPQHGTIELNIDGTFRYQPHPNYYGSDSFTYRVSDGRLLSNLATVTIDVRSVNDRPVSQSDAYLLARRDQPLSAPLGNGLLANDTDPEGNPLTARLVTPPTRGSVVLRPDGTFTYTPNASFTLTDSFTYRANDGKLDSPVTTVSIELDVPRITVGDIELRANTPNQQVPIYVQSSARVAGANLFLQVGDGGPELSQFGVPAGIDGPAISGIDLKSGTIFASVADPQVDQPGIPQVATSTIALSSGSDTVMADGLLATITIDTTGFFKGTWDLKLTDVLPYPQLNGPFATDFAGTAAIIRSGRLIVQEAAVVNRQLFYGNSPLGTMPIATDKRALLPGQTASFANYSSYSRGINGVLVDVTGFLREPQVSDFEFRAGRSNNLTTWDTAPAPNRFEVLTTDDEDVQRVVIGWEDGQIFNQWLEVKLLPSPTSGVVAADLFYFGNAPGETGDSTTNTLVNATDIVATRDNKRGPFNMATLDDRYDFNRDGLVNATDVIFARDNVTSPFNALPLISLPATAASAAARGAVPRAPLPVQNVQASLPVRSASALSPPLQVAPTDRLQVTSSSNPPGGDSRDRSPTGVTKRLSAAVERRLSRHAATDEALSAFHIKSAYDIARSAEHLWERLL